MHKTVEILNSFRFRYQINPGGLTAQAGRPPSAQAGTGPGTHHYRP